MAEQTYLLSPGSLTTENDRSYLTPQPIYVGAAIVGPTVKGQVEVPTPVTSYPEFVSKFGDVLMSGSNTYSYLTSIAAYNYFSNGGQSLLITRVVSGSYTPATASINGSGSAGVAFELETISEGSMLNSVSPEIASSLTSGSKDNIRYEIIASDTASGTFNLLIRRGDDTHTNKILLESFTNLSLDPLSPNFISKIIGDQKLKINKSDVQYFMDVTGSYANNSNYVRVKSVKLLTPSYFDNNGLPNSLYTGSIPLAGSGSFGGALGQVKAGANFYQNINDTDTQGLVADNYDDMINLLSNKDDYQFREIITPGLLSDQTTHYTKINNIINNISQGRTDNLYIVDLKSFGGTVLGVINEAKKYNSSYGTTYWPWLQTVDPSLGTNVWVPASTMALGVYAYNDKVAEPWFAPAGINRGGLSTVIRAERKVPQSDRDSLYLGRVNPIKTDARFGVSIFGNKTLQLKASALDRVNVRRLLIALKTYIGQVADTLVFDPNTTSTRNSFLNRVNPYLESVKQRQGLYSFKVVMDATNNGNTEIDQNKIIGQIYLQPTKTGEFVLIGFNIDPTSGLTLS